jgi:hypothetical protein
MKPFICYFVAVNNHINKTLNKIAYDPKKECAVLSALPDGARTAMTTGSLFTMSHGDPTQDEPTDR